MIQGDVWSESTQMISRQTFLMSIFNICVDSDQTKNLQNITDTPSQM